MIKILKVRKSFRKEFKQRLKLAIIAAIGFTIAYAWKETILKIMENTSINIAAATSLGYSPLFMPIFTTFLGVILLLILTKLLKD